MHGWQASKLRPSQKLKPLRYGPFKVSSCESNDNYKLKLPSILRVHPVFHVSKLLLSVKDPDAPQPPAAIPVDGFDEFEVEEILDVRRYGRHKTKQYLVKWAGYPLQDATWEPVGNLKNCKEILKRFESQVASSMSGGVRKSVMRFKI